jgi:hypothetical protein
MAWIESHQQLLSHPKTLNLMNLMSWDIDTTIGKLQRFWWWCIDYAPDGDLRRYNALNLGAAVGLSRKKADQFVSAMIDSGWLDTEPYFRVHDWWAYAGPFLQSKHKRHPVVWQRVRDLYQGKCNPSQKVQNDKYSTAQHEQLHRCCTDRSERSEGDSTSENVQTLRYCAVPPDLTKPDLTNQTQKQQQQQHPDSFGTDLNSEHPGRHQQQPSPIPSIEAGAVAETAGPGHSEPTTKSGNDQLQQDRPTLPIRASPENTLQRILRDRIGRHTQLSRCDMDKIMTLRNKHGPDFFSACESLHSGVTNPASYLLAILEPENTTVELARKLKELVDKRG